MTRPLRTITRCLVCGFTEIRTDEVVDRGLVLLGECPHCQHRWTERPVAQLTPIRRTAAAAELPSAA